MTGADGRPVRIAEPLWDRATRDALMTATAPKRDGKRAPKGLRLLTGAAFCGNCGARVHVKGRAYARHAYECTARIRGIRASADCQPAPCISMAAADAVVSEWFLARYGAGEVMRKIYDPGTGHAAQIAELEATRARLREDRQAGLYDSADDAEWYRTEYRRLGEEIAALKALPERKPGMRMVPTGRTIAQEWEAADNARRREMLAEFEVRVVLHPTGHDPRVAVAGMKSSRPGPGWPTDKPVQRRNRPAPTWVGGRAVSPPFRPLLRCGECRNQIAHRAAHPRGHSHVAHQEPSVCRHAVTGLASTVAAGQGAKAMTRTPRSGWALRRHRSAPPSVPTATTARMAVGKRASHSPFSGVWMVPPARALAAAARRRDRVVICHPGAPVTGAAQGLRRFGVRES